MTQWDAFVSDRDKEVFRRAGYGKKALKVSRPAVFVIDMTHAFLGDRPQPIMESMERYPNSCGEEGWEVVRRLEPFLRSIRKANVPVFYSIKDVRGGARNADVWAGTREGPADVEGQSPYGTIVDAITPATDVDSIVRKLAPSAFFGTPLLQQLISRHIDQIICTGATTSGCVRATVVDGFSYGYDVIVAEDGVCDRGEASHALSLFDMAQKYATVRTLDTIESAVRGETDDVG